MPAAEVEIDAELVGRLLEAQCPELAGRPLSLVANGWDNTIFRLGDDLCVRLPRRQVAVQLIRNENRWLPLLASRVSVPVPAPVYVGEPGEGFAWPWSVCRWIEGVVASEVPPPQRRSLAPGLGAFFRALHVPAPSDAPRNPVRGVALSERSPAFYERLHAVPDASELTAMWEELVAVPQWQGPPVWVHGDPHPANILIGQSGLAGVLDFGDLTAGDPATDLAAGWFVFDEPGRRSFREHLGDIDDDTWERARGWALNIGTAIVAHTDDNPRMAQVGRHVLEQLLV
ncbi:aminoglycoside phosphotransferase family protein [Rhizocola hellebori]|nr:aminoglycoside phosphotransferase family protein [Rhizocola hellebori]